MQHFLDIDAIDVGDLRDIIESSKRIKASLKNGKSYKPLLDKQLAMLFEKPSTRTRVSFEVGINQLGGSAIVLGIEGSQIGRGESIADTAQVLSRYVDLMMIRCFDHHSLIELAQNASVPVINGLTNHSHPCQIMADILTFEEHVGDIKGKTVAWIGDYNNVTRSWCHAAQKFGFSLQMATPSKVRPDEVFPGTTWHELPADAAANADLVTTDTWVSMGDDEDQEKIALLQQYQVNEAVMDAASDEAIFLHCLPAHRGEEVTSDVIDGPRSRIFDEAENRLHIQKSIMIWCLKN